MQRGDVNEMDRVLKTDPRLAHGSAQFNVSPKRTTLNWAIRSQNSKVVDRVLEEHPDPEERSAQGETPLHCAVLSGAIPLVTKLLDYGADVNSVDEQGAAPIHMAVEGRDAILKLLIQSGANPQAPRHDGKTPLHLAAERGNLVAVTELLQAGATVDVKDQDGDTPLHDSFKRYRLEVGQRLLEYGADLTAPNKAGLIPGQNRDGTNNEVAARLWWDEIKKLYDKGDVAKVDEMLDAAPQALLFRVESIPQTLLERAIHANRVDLFGYFLARCAKANVQDSDLDAALRYASWCNADFVERLLIAGANINAKDDAGKSALHWAANAQNKNTLQLLIEKGANLAAVDNAGTSVLDALFERSFHRSDNAALAVLRQAGHPATLLSAAAEGDVGQLRTLSGGDLSSLDRAYTANGVRPLHAAVLGGQPQTVRWLIERGVDRNASGSKRNGRSEAFIFPVPTPLQMALSHGNDEIALLLVQLGVDVNIAANRDMPPVGAVIAYGRSPEVLKAILAHNPNLSATFRNQTVVDLARASKSKYRDQYLELLRSIPAK